MILSILLNLVILSPWLIVAVVGELMEGDNI